MAICYTPCRLDETDCKMNDLEWPWVAIWLYNLTMAAVLSLWFTYSFNNLIGELLSILRTVSHVINTNMAELVCNFIRYSWWLLFLCSSARVCSILFSQWCHTYWTVILISRAILSVIPRYQPKDCHHRRGSGVRLARCHSLNYRTWKGVWGTEVPQWGPGVKPR